MLTEQSSIGKEAGPDLECFYKLGGEYNVTLGRWMKASSQTNVLLTRLSTIAEIEGAGTTKLVQ